MAERMKSNTRDLLGDVLFCAGFVVLSMALAACAVVAVLYPLMAASAR